jgi:hypothetical protein
MSQSGSLRDKGKEQGQYGPNDPPPPPMDPAPSKADRKRGQDVLSPPPQHSSPAKGAERPWKMLNSRQRKKRRLDNEEPAMDTSRDRDRDCSAVHQGRSLDHREQQSSPKRYSEQSPMRPEREKNRPIRRRNPQQSDRQSLRDARQFTPDQIIDETYGRLSPGMNIRDHYQNPFDKAQHQSLERTGWPDERPLSPRRDSSGDTRRERQFGGHSKGEHDVLRPL